MNARNIFICFLLCICLKFRNICCDTPRSCLLHNSNGNKIKPQLLKRLSPLTGHTFQVVHDEYRYSIAICSNVSNHNLNDDNASATQQYKDNEKQVVVLGRSNDTDIIGKDSWLLLTYGGGDLYSNTTPSCNGSRKSTILITCNTNANKPVLEFVENNEVWKKDSCFYMFELQTSAICPAKPEEGLSHGSVFCIIFLTSVGVYLVVGVFYRRIVKGAKGFEQIPHHEFWIKLGNLQADGCNYICRRDDRREESWRRLTNNFNDPQDERDDALLRP